MLGYMTEHEAAEQLTIVMRVIDGLMLELLFPDRDPSDPDRNTA